MTDFLALISDSQAEGRFHGVLICKRIVPNRLHWFVLENHDLTLARGSVECGRHALSAQACVDLVVESVAHQIGIDPDQIQVMRDTVTPVAPQNDHIATMIEFDSTPTSAKRGRPPSTRATKARLCLPVGP
jgi:hypothetical protein